MNATNAESEIKPLVRNLLSRDSVQFNAAINAHFAPDCTYHGRGLQIAGASQLKHANYLLNTIDLGSDATLADSDIRWDAAGSTAIVKAVRHVRPLAFPLFTFAVPTRITLSFRAADGDKMLHATQWRDEWPLELFISQLPLLGLAYRSLVVPLLSAVFLVVANFVFWVHTKRERVEHKYVHDAAQTYRRSVRPHLPRSLVQGFDAGVHAAENVGQQGAGVVSRIARRPLELVEQVARTATVVANLALPHQLQLPYPSVFTECAERAVETAKPAAEGEKPEHAEKVDAEKAKAGSAGLAERKEGEVPGSPRSKVSGSPHVAADEGDKKRKAEATAPAEARHAKVVVGKAEDGSQQAKEIDVVTHAVTEQAPAHESAQQSLYDVLKKDDQIPHANAEASRSNGAGKKAGSKKKKNTGRK